MYKTKVGGQWVNYKLLPYGNNQQRHLVSYTSEQQINLLETLNVSQNI